MIAEVYPPLFQVRIVSSIVLDLTGRQLRQPLLRLDDQRLALVVARRRRLPGRRRRRRHRQRVVFHRRADETARHVDALAHRGRRRRRLLMVLLVMLRQVVKRRQNVDVVRVAGVGDERHDAVAPRFEVRIPAAVVDAVNHHRSVIAVTVGVCRDVLS